jgi:N-acetylmuramoyl-L-alanine amidase
MRGTAQRIVQIGTLVLLVGCGASVATVGGGSGSSTAPPSASRSTASPRADPSPGIVAAPGSNSSVFPFNPGAIVVYIDPGHGGCLDWGVPNPYDNTASNAEKTMTLGIGLALRELLAADGVSVVLSRTTDSAVAGDLDPAYGCQGDPFRDVNGDGETGFDPEGFTLARDELTARIDLANLARADVFVSIHINSMTENGEVYPIAATQTFYTDETAWGESSARLATDVQRGVVAALDGVADYDRQDRGTQAINYFVVAPPLLEPTDEEPDPRKRPRGIEMPGVLAEVGSMSLEHEAELLATHEGQRTVAEGLFAALVAYLGDRPLAVRYDVALPGGEAGRRTRATPGLGPPFEAPVVDADELVEPVGIRFTNTGTDRWPRDLTLAAAWSATDEPYLAAAPALETLDVEIPPLAAGEAAELAVAIPRPPDQVRSVLWVTLVSPQRSLAELGSPPIQLAVRPQ